VIVHVNLLISEFRLDPHSLCWDPTWR